MGISVQATQELTGKLNQDPRTEYVEFNYIVELAFSPNDPQLGLLWGLHNTGQTGGTADADIDAPEAWNVTTGSSNVIVGIIGTGVNGTANAGVNWTVSIAACKFLSAAGSGTLANAVKCFKYFNRLKHVQGQNIFITNNSWDVTAYVNTASRVNSLELYIGNNERNGKKTKTDYVYVVVEWGL